MADGSVRLERYEPNRALRRLLLRSAAAKAAVEARGRQVQAAASRMYGASGYGLRVKVGKERARAVVYTADAHAMRSNALHGTLKKALGGK